MVHLPLPVIATVSYSFEAIEQSTFWDPVLLFTANIGPPLWACQESDTQVEQNALRPFVLNESNLLWAEGKVFLVFLPKQPCYVFVEVIQINGGSARFLETNHQWNNAKYFSRTMPNTSEHVYHIFRYLLRKHFKFIAFNCILLYDIFMTLLFTW